jgi:hypothetical protein
MAGHNITHVIFEGGMETELAKLKPASGSRKFPQFRVQKFRRTTMHTG